jgi:hypothetical protein
MKPIAYDRNERQQLRLPSSAKKPINRTQLHRSQSIWYNQYWSIRANTLAPSALCDHPRRTDPSASNNTGSYNPYWLIVGTSAHFNLRFGCLFTFCEHHQVFVSVDPDSNSQWRQMNFCEEILVSNPSLNIVDPGFNSQWQLENGRPILDKVWV